ncbi:Hypothetical predicted protein [Marmota monax]|uniref:Uncharacterized protein n=1 Tax=Marmota monax TaxID=9995 RepID=A0A5E4D994_MARMO|nr:Hypothetical predicted protein [Marmota monax]
MALAPALLRRTPTTAPNPCRGTPGLRRSRRARPWSRRVRRAPTGRTWAESRAGNAPSGGPSRETRRPELSGDPAPKRNPQLLSNRSRRRRLALRYPEQVECSSRLLLRQPRVAPTSRPAAAPRLVEFLLLALPATLWLCRLPNAHLLHRKPGSSTPDMTSALTDRTSGAMGTYTYTSRPRVLPCQRRRYRDNLLQP